MDVNGWIELDDPQFQKHFRMTRIVFNKLLSSIRDHLRKKGRLQRDRTAPELCLMMALWIIMNMDTFKNTALQFFTTPGVVLYHYLYVIEALRDMAPDYIQWPSQEERLNIKERFLQTYGYPGVVGAIDGTHSYITAPLDEPQAYVNRHHSYSILSQAVVDDNLIVRDLYVGECGSLHDSRVFRRSPLSSNLLENPDLLEDEHILGDGAYILTDKVIVPYPDNGALTEVQRHHNYMLSSCRQSVERSFGSVKMKFPRLKYFRSLRVVYAVDHILSCFVLHNFIGFEGEKYQLIGLEPNQQNIQPPPEGAPIELGEAREVGDFPNVNIEPDHPLLAEARINGVDKRERIAARLFEERNV